MRAYWYFLRLLQREWGSALAGVVMSLIASLASISLMGTAMWFLTAMAIAGAADVVLNIFIPSALIRLLALARTLLRYGERYITHDATFKILAWLRVFLVERVMALEYEEAVKLNTADIQRRLHADTEKLEMLYVRECVPALCALIIGFIWGCVLFSFSVPLGCAVMGIFLFAAVLAPIMITLQVYKLSLDQSKLNEELHTKANTILSGFIDLMLLQRIGGFAKDFLDHSQKLAKVRARLTFHDLFLQSILLFCAEISMCVVLVMATPLFIAKEISGAQLMMLAVVALAVYEVLVPLGSAYLQFAQVVHAANRVATLLHITKSNAYVELVLEESKKQEARQESAEDEARPCVSEVRLEDVDFYWESDKRIILNECSFTFKSDTNYLLQAPSGAGKSTLILLLTGLVYPKSGTLYLNNREYAHYKSSALRTHFATLQQNTILFAGTVRECFTKVKPKVTDAEIMNWLRLVELQDFVLQLPHGLDEYLGPTGFNLSGGQARRLALARTLLVETADFLLLDEVGEGLDLQQEERILQRLLQLRRGLIIISHRQLSQEFCDHVVCLQDGKLCERV